VWNVAKTPGTVNVRIMISNYTSTFREKGFQSVGNVGPRWRIEMWSGEIWKVSV
jgi:hypothetical protein